MNAAGMGGARRAEPPVGAETSTSTSRPVAPSRGRLRPLGLHEVRITGGFWGHRQRVNGSATLEHCLAWMERLGWLGNLDRKSVV